MAAKLTKRKEQQRSEQGKNKKQKTHDTDTRRSLVKISKTKKWFLKTFKKLTNFQNKKKREDSINKVRKARDGTTDNIEIKEFYGTTMNNFTPTNWVTQKKYSHFQKHTIYQG